MARPKSEDKRNAILSAAIEIFAERGLAAAPTSEISKRAGIAEGTLFTYFKTKDELVNTLYRELKQSLAESMMEEFPAKKDIRARLQHVWNGYISWGIANPEQRKVLAQLQVSEALTKESKEAASAPFVECQNTVREAFEQRILRSDLPSELVSRTLGAIAETTMDLMATNPKAADRYRKSGFDLLWAGITCK